MHQYLSTVQNNFNNDFIYLKNYEQQESIVPDVAAVDLISQGKDSNQTKKYKDHIQFTIDFSQNWKFIWDYILEESHIIVLNVKQDLLLKDIWSNIYEYTATTKNYLDVPNASDSDALESRCSKRFPPKKYLYEHLQTHRNDKPFKCPETKCSKGFTIERYLKNRWFEKHFFIDFHSKFYIKYYT